MSDVFDLAAILNNRRWERHDDPFPYVFADKVFVKDFYDALDVQLRLILAKGITENAKASGQFARNMVGYDAYGSNISQHKDGPLGLFISPEWHDMTANLFGIRGTGYVNAGLHHHVVKSQNGFIHNDFNPVWFPVEGEGRIRLPAENNVCAYKTGQGSLQDHQKIEVVRGVAMLFYLGNEDWYPGAGGETGLFRNGDDPIRKPVKKVPPRNNSLLMYECTPSSWHSFLSNRHSPRSCVVMWVHRPMEEAAEVHGADKLERWER